jgi:probable HAF family extracellular repeat protein
VNEYGYAFTVPYGINDRSEVVGSSDGKVFLWDRTLGLQDLGISGTAYDINNSSQVVGVASINNQGTAFIREKNGSLQTLGALGSGGNGETLSIAYDINEKGQVIGTSTSAVGNRPVLWENNAIADLNNLIPSNSGWTLDTVTAINDQGLIVGTGRINGKARAFVLTPKSIPEPAITSALLLFAAVLIVKRCF